MPRGYMSQLQDFPMAKAGRNNLNNKINKEVLDYKPNCKITIYESVLI